MRNFGWIILIALLGFTSCDINCFREKITECQEKSTNDDAETLCELQIAAVLCTNESAEACKTGFEAEASEYFSIVKEACTEGTKLNIGIKGDENCGLDKPVEADHCAKDLGEDMRQPGRDPSDFVGTNKILCKWVDSVTECLYKAFEKQCKKETQDAFRTIYDSAAALQKKICSVLPDSQKRAILTTNIYRSPFLALL